MKKNKIKFSEFQKKVPFPQGFSELKISFLQNLEIRVNCFVRLFFASSDSVEKGIYVRLHRINFLSGCFIFVIEK